MENDNKSDYTKEATSKLLTRIAKLNELEKVKRYIAQLKTKDGYKKALCNAYDRYTQYYKIQ